MTVQTPAEVSAPGKTLGIVGFILAFLFPLVGLILSLVANSQSKKAGIKNTLATAGVIVSIVMMVLGAVIMIVSISAMMAVPGYGY